MKVHVVTRDWQSGQVLARLVRDLVAYTGWSVGPKPDPKADVNYFFPYLEIGGYRGFSATKSAAWFSHYDENRAGKPELWQAAAASVDLRLTCARLYQDALGRYGPIRLVTPPLDREHFSPGRRALDGLKALPRSSPAVVGVSGYVYPGGRKGEGLVKRLADYQLEMNFALRASGAGWPCPTTEYAWADLPGFYHGLDVFVCASTIEGIPLPPLEAMACGIPVVIPREVGLLDDLPSLQNVHRYKAGDFDDLLSALADALAVPVNHESLRGATARFSEQAWGDTHLDAFEAEFGRRFYPVGPLPAWQGNAGVYYVAYGDPARECAYRAISSLHRYMPGLPAALISAEPLGIEDIFIQNADEDIGGRSVKTQIYSLAPASWQYVLYLDADTEVVADIGFLFDTLADGWELVFCINPAQYHLAAEMVRPDNAIECAVTFEQLGTDQILQLNGGVFSFRRCPPTQKFFTRWHEEWQRYGARDQAALDRALYAEPLRLYVLGNEWNTITRYLPAERTAGILHYPMQARRWKGRIDGRLDSSEAWGAVHPSFRPPHTRSG